MVTSDVYKRQGPGRGVDVNGVRCPDRRAGGAEIIAALPRKDVYKRQGSGQCQSLYVSRHGEDAVPGLPASRFEQAATGIDLIPANKRLADAAARLQVKMCIRDRSFTCPWALPPWSWRSGRWAAGSPAVARICKWYSDSISVSAWSRPPMRFNRFLCL